MSRLRDSVPDLAGIRAVSARLAALDRVRFDETLRAAVSDVGRPCDLTDAGNARRLRIWLNQWLCRIRYPRPGEPDYFVDSVGAWWLSVESNLPSVERTLSKMKDSDLEALADAYDDLVVRPARLRRGKPSSFGPTVAAKLLFYQRPLGVTAWDLKISAHANGDFRLHLYKCRHWARAIAAEAKTAGIAEKDIGPSMMRSESSLAKLIDEFMYQTVTRSK